MRTFDLNCAAVELYPVTKLLAESDLTTSQLVLLRNSVEEFILPSMPQGLRDRLTEEGRANIWVIDDDKYLEHHMTMVDHNHQYSLIDWSRICQSRSLREGLEIRFRWIDGELHFILAPEGLRGEDGYFNNNDDNNDEGTQDKTEDHQHEGEQGPENGADKDEDEDEPPAKQLKTCKS